MRTLRQLLVKPKDPVPPNLINGIIYRVPCKQCNKVYVGQTGRFDCRLKEHKRAVKCGNLQLLKIFGRSAMNLTGKQQVFLIHASISSQMSFGVMACTQTSYYQNVEPYRLFIVCYNIISVLRYTVMFLYTYTYA